jgi:diguanylate cyclase (GGDEF)-like protein
MTDRTGDRTVLVVDDEQLFLEFLSSVVEQEHSVLTANNGAQAIEIARKSNPDLILLDVEMPDLHGFDVLRSLKADPITADIPVIFVTATTSSSAEVEGLAMGAVDYITKPLVPIIVSARVNSQLELKAQRDFLRQLATLDGLTGISNRRAFDEGLAMEWRRSQRNETSLSLIFIDIDHFKLFNDSYGHLEGDDCLKRFAAALNKCLRRPGDLFARYGGEEFVCLMPDTDIEGAQGVAEKMQKAVKWLDIRHATSLENALLTASFGLTATVASNNQNLSELIAQADSALYEAKKKGRDCIVRAQV